MPKKFMHDLEIKKVALVRKAANKRKFLIFKAEDTEEEDSKTMPNFIDVLKEKLNAVFEDPELVKAAPAVDDLEDDDSEKVTKETKTEPSVEDVIKEHKLPEEVVELLKSQSAANAENTQAIEDLRKSIEDDKKAREAEEIQTTATSFKFLPVEAEELTKSLGALKGTEGYEEVVGMLQKLDKVAQDNTLFDTVGSGRTPVEKSADERVGKITKEIREANPDLSEEEVLTKAYEDNPDLYDAQVGRVPNVGDHEEVD